MISSVEKKLLQLDTLIFIVEYFLDVTFSYDINYRFLRRIYHDSYT